MTISGAVAQLGERMNGIHEVEGSTPFGSTSYYIKLQYHRYYSGLGTNDAGRKPTGILERGWNTPPILM
jgi:hypothetical protein